ncbi:MAG: aminotransferase [Pseudomonadota bacterium]
MTRFNPNLAAVSASPIMQATAWVRETALPEGLPLIDLSQAAPASPPPKQIREQLARAMLEDDSAHFYGRVLGNDALRQAVADRTAALYGGAVQDNQVAITAGCNQAFCVAVATACGPGDALALPHPWYFNHKMWLDMAGIHCVPLPTGPDMLPDPASIDALPDNVRAIALVSPNNPTGAEYSETLLQAFYERARDSGRLLILDETYRDFHSAPGAPHGLFTNTDWPEVLAHLYSFSKAFRMTGHRTGALVTGQARIDQAAKFLDTVTISAAQPGQIAALYGLTHLTQWVEGERHVYLQRRRLLESLMVQHLPNWQLHGAGAYFAWISPPGDAPAEQTARTLLAEQAILALPGTMFLPDGMESTAMRVAFANADDQGLAETVNRLVAYERQHA